MSDRVRGKVKWFNASKGYGFLERPDGEGEAVEFSIATTDKGLQAEDVNKMN